MSSITLENPAFSTPRETGEASRRVPEGLARLAIGAKKFAFEGADRRAAAHQESMAMLSEAHSSLDRVATPMIDALGETVAKRNENHSGNPNGLQAWKATPDGRLISLTYNEIDKTRGGKAIKVDPKHSPWDLRVMKDGKQVSAYNLRLSTAHNGGGLAVNTIDKHGKAMSLDSYSPEEEAAMCKNVESDLSWLAAGLPDHSLAIDTIYPEAAAPARVAHRQAQAKPRLVAQHA